MNLEDFVFEKGVPLSQADGIKERLKKLPDNTIRTLSGKGLFKVGMDCDHLIVANMNCPIWEIHVPEGSKDVEYKSREEGMHQISFNYQGQRYAIQHHPIKTP